MVEVFGYPETRVHREIIAWFEYSKFSDAFLLFEFKSLRPYQTQIDLLVLRPNQSGIWFIEIKNKKITKVSVNGFWEYEHWETGKSTILSQRRNPYKQAEKAADTFKDWLASRIPQLFPNDTELIEFSRTHNFKAFPCVLIKAESTPTTDPFEEDDWVYLCVGNDDLPKTLKEKWDDGVNDQPPVFTKNHIFQIVESLSLPKRNFKTFRMPSGEVRVSKILKIALPEENGFEEVKKIATVEEFLNLAQESTLSEFIDMIQDNKQRIAKWGGLNLILDELGIELLTDKILSECSLDAAIFLLNNAYISRWQKLTALLDQINLKGFLDLIQSENYEDLSILKSLHRYRWARLVILEYELFRQGLQEQREKSFKIFNAIRYDHKTPLWAKKWLTVEEILTALQKNPELSLYGLLEFIEQNAPKFYFPILKVILLDGARSFPFQMLLHCIDRIKPEDTTKLQGFDSDWEIDDLARQLVASETGWLSFFFSISTKLTFQTLEHFLNALDLTGLRQNILKGDEDMPYAWINLISALRDVKWSKLGNLLDSLKVNFLLNVFYNPEIAVLTSKLLNVLLLEDWKNKEVFIKKFAAENWIDPETKTHLLDFHHLDILLSCEFPGAIGLAKRTFQTVFTQKPISWEIRKYLDLFDRMGINWHPWLTPEMIISADEKGYFIRDVLEDLENRGWSFSQSVREFFAEKDTNEQKKVFCQFPLSYRARIRLTEGLLDEALDLFAQAMNKFNSKPTAQKLRNLIRDSEKLSFEKRQYLFSNINEEALAFVCEKDPLLIHIIGEELAQLCDKTIIRVIMQFLRHQESFFKYIGVINFFSNSCGNEFIEEAINAKAILVLSDMARSDSTRQAVLTRLSQKNALIDLISDLNPTNPFWDSIKLIIDTFNKHIRSEVIQNIIESATNQRKPHLIRVLLSLSSDYAEKIVQHLLSLPQDILHTLLNQSEPVEIISLIFEIQEQMPSHALELLETLLRRFRSIITEISHNKENKLLLDLLRRE